MATQRLVNSTIDIQNAFGPVQTDLDFDTIGSMVDSVEEEFVITRVGFNFYDQLRQDALNDKFTRAKHLLQKSIANFTINNFLAAGSVQINSSGVFVIKTGDKLPASDKKLYQLRLQSRADGYKFLELAINYLEDNSVSFPQYIGDVAHARNRANLINTTNDFNTYFNLNNNFEVFGRLKSVMGTIEENYIQPALGKQVSDALYSAILNNSTTNPQKKLLDRIARALAPLTIAEAIPYQLFNFDASGLVTATIKGNIENIEVNTEAGMGALQMTMLKSQMRGESEMAKLRRFLNDNAADYTGYAPVVLDGASKLNDTGIYAQRGVYIV